MGLLTRLFGGKAGTAERLARSAYALVVPTPGTPSRVAAVPGHVGVAFHAHDEVDGIQGSFLTAVTEGLDACRQRELVLTLRLVDGEVPLAKMQDITLFVATVWAWAQQGNIVDEGGFTQFGERGLFERPRSGLLYADARALPGVRLPERALSAIAVDAQEVRTALDYGTYRVLTRIGFQLRLFPFPTWGALDRPSAVTAREAESELSRLSRMRAPGVSFVVAEQRLCLSIPSDTSALARGLRSLQSSARFALLTRPAASANAILVWHPGQEGPSGISPDGSDGSQLSGSCLVVTPGGAGDQIQPFEDGYALLFSGHSWARVTAAVVEQRPLSLNMADGMRFEIEWPTKTG